MAASRTGPALVEDEAKPKAKLTRVLPCDRVSFAKQLEILRGYAAASSQGARVVTNVEVASTIKMAPETISACNAFFSNVGFIQKGGGGWLVSAEVLAFHRAFDWNKETASHKLAPLIQSSWFYQGLQAKLSFRAIEEEEAVSELGDLASATPDQKRALKMLLDCLEAGGVIQREGSLLKLRTPSRPDAGVPQNQDQASSSEPAGDVTPRVSRVATAFSQTPQIAMPQGRMRFNVSFDLDLAEIATWKADRIAAFFNGIAQVLAAKAEVEKTAGL